MHPAFGVANSIVPLPDARGAGCPSTVAPVARHGVRIRANPSQAKKMHIERRKMPTERRNGQVFGSSASLCIKTLQDSFTLTTSSITHPHSIRFLSSIFPAKSVNSGHLSRKSGFQSSSFEESCLALVKRGIELASTRINGRTRSRKW